MPPPPTARLEFRRWRRDDLALALSLWGDAEVMRLLGGAYDERAARERLEAEIGFEETLGVQYWPISCSAKAWPPKVNESTGARKRLLESAELSHRRVRPTPEASASRAGRA